MTYGEYYQKSRMIIAMYNICAFLGFLLITYIVVSLIAFIGFFIYTKKMERKDRMEQERLKSNLLNGKE